LWRIRCLYFQLAGHAPERPLVFFAGALLLRAAVAAGFLALVSALYPSRITTLLAVTWLMGGLAGWTGISSLEATGPLAFGPRAMSTVAILWGLVLVTRGYAGSAGILLGAALYTHALNAVLAILTAGIFLALPVLKRSERRSAVVRLAIFGAVAGVMVLPFWLSMRGESAGTLVSLKDWVAMWHVAEPDDTSLLYSGRWLGVDWYVLQALGGLSLAWVVQKQGRSWLAQPAVRWIVATWVILLVAGFCEAFYTKLPDYPFVWILQLQFRRMVWMSSLFLLPAIPHALVLATHSSSGTERTSGWLGLIVASVFLLLRFSSFMLAGALAMVILAVVTASLVHEPQWRIALGFFAGAGLVAVPDLLRRLAGPAPEIDTWPLVTFAHRVFAPIGRATGLIAAAFVAVAPALPAPFRNRSKRWVSVAAGVYLLLFFARISVSNSEGLLLFGQSWPGLTLTRRLSLAEWMDFLRQHDYYYAARIATGALDPTATRLLEEAAVAVQRETPTSALLLVPVDAGLMRGLTKRSVFLLEDEDSDSSMFSVAVWAQFKDRFTDMFAVEFVEYTKAQRLAPERTPGLRQMYLALTESRLSALVERYGVTHMLTEKSHALPFSLVHLNEQYVLYNLSAPQPSLPPVR
jgi:hypothetical protein